MQGNLKLPIKAGQGSANQARPVAESTIVNEAGAMQSPAAELVVLSGVGLKPTELIRWKRMPLDAAFGAPAIVAYEGYDSAHQPGARELAYLLAGHRGYFDYVKADDVAALRQPLNDL
jgi:hypothetical protein